jgi:hypothetical protein
MHRQFSDKIPLIASSWNVNTRVLAISMLMTISFGVQVSIASENLACQKIFQQLHSKTARLFDGQLLERSLIGNKSSVLIDSDVLKNYSVELEYILHGNQFDWGRKISKLLKNTYFSDISKSDVKGVIVLTYDLLLKATIYEIKNNHVEKNYSNNYVEEMRKNQQTVLAGLRAFFYSNKEAFSNEDVLAIKKELLVLSTSNPKENIFENTIVLSFLTANWRLNADMQTPMSRYSLVAEDLEFRINVLDLMNLQKYPKISNGNLIFINQILEEMLGQPDTYKRRNGSVSEIDKIVSRIVNYFSGSVYSFSKSKEVVRAYYFSDPRNAIIAKKFIQLVQDLADNHIINKHQEDQLLDSLELEDFPKSFFEEEP